MTRNHLNRRRLLQAAAALPVVGALPVADALSNAGTAGTPAGGVLRVSPSEDKRILVVVELSGGNDGLNTVVPYGDDAYYRHRPTIGLPADSLLKLDDHFGLNPGMLGFQRLWQSGDLAIVHGCGYDRPSFSHFTSMAYWHTAAPNAGKEYGWVGRLADVMAPQPRTNYLINIDTAQSLAVKSRLHTPVVFDDPNRFQRRGFAAEQALLDRVGVATGEGGSAAYLNAVARSARDGARLIREAWNRYQTSIDYGIVPLDLDKVAACIAADLPTRLYYVAFRNNAFDTHVQQGNLHRRLLSYACDAIHGFIADLERLGQADRVTLLAFSEFGRRVPENANLGTDHGAANVMFLAGKPVQGGHYGVLPSLTALDEGDNLIPTTDFRRVYASVIDGWVAPGQSATVLDRQFDTLPVFA